MIPLLIRLRERSQVRTKCHEVTWKEINWRWTWDKEVAVMNWKQMIHSNDAWTDNQRSGCAKDGAVQSKATVAWVHEMGKQGEPVEKQDHSDSGPTFTDPLSNCMKIHRDKLPPKKDDWEERQVQNNKGMDERGLKNEEIMRHGIFPLSGYASSGLMVFFPSYPDSWQTELVLGTAKPELPMDYWEFQ